MKWDEKYAHKADAFASTHRWTQEAKEIIVYAGGGDTVLDVGCNTGRLGMAFKASGRDIRYVGMDPNPSALDIAKKRLPNAKFVTDLKQIVDDGVFDMVYVLHTINQMEDRDASFVKIWNLLKPYGRVVITTHNPLHYVTRVSNLWNGYKSDPTMIWEPKLGELKQFVWDHGFFPEEVRYMGTKHWSRIRALQERLIVVGRKPFA